MCEKDGPYLQQPPVLLLFIKLLFIFQEEPKNQTHQNSEWHQQDEKHSLLWNRPVILALRIHTQQH